MKKILLFSLPVLLIGLTAAYFLYNKPHQKMENADVDMTVSAFDLFVEFDQNEAKANEKYLEKILLVEGKITDVSTNEEGHVSLTLKSSSDMFGVICQMDQLTEHERTDFTVGETVTLKGICTGMLMDVVLVRCVEV
ncbi:OB-fold protein [Flavilitoribacter nigricans]|uniref:tRNA_anti-like n=1 Tax=Flavilitoribacter nigricans (strain ATCC 23147 / DSM 23189 / NBRC 102662 / NCIMB 1420 / SS-2) TaxID=1122177 RepID=A0A2D0NJP1_FLAN2|nr:hypothetical protein [Flavilitoribacter nigricans]PHN07953.1 hypothetical protein CRP01_04145 [Flavilitoribacter nigricans DSM 23189 = NBRC 102662]